MSVPDSYEDKTMSVPDSYEDKTMSVPDEMFMLTGFAILMRMYYDIYIECVVAGNYMELLKEQVNPQGPRANYMFIDDDVLFSDTRFNELYNKWIDQVLEDAPVTVYSDIVEKEFPLPLDKAQLQHDLSITLSKACVEHLGGNVFESTSVDVDTQFRFPTVEDEDQDEDQDTVQTIFYFFDNGIHEWYKDYTREEQEDRADIYREKASVYHGQAEIIYRFMRDHMLGELIDIAFESCSCFEEDGELCEVCIEHEDHWFYKLYKTPCTYTLNPNLRNVT
jgi:hypothetical protein